MEKEIIKNASPPFIHKEGFLAERGQFGYNPSFIPNTISFGLKDIPFIKDDLVIQYYSNGIWHTIDLSPILKEKFPLWTGFLPKKKTYIADERIVFNSDGDFFTGIRSFNWKGILTNCLFFYSKKFNKWSIYDLPPEYDYYKLEAQDGHNTILDVPGIILSGTKTKKVALLIPKINSHDGTLNLTNIKVLDQKSGIQSGGWGSNQCITYHNNIFVVWASFHQKKKGIATYISKYDKTKNEIVDKFYLGISGEKLNDLHNIPCITIDSEGIIHIILSAHHNQFQYIKSKKRGQISYWTTPKNIEGKKETIGNTIEDCIRNCHYYTYPTFICDLKDNLHLMSRWAGSTKEFAYRMRLVHMQKSRNMDWSGRKTLVVPCKKFYTNWYQKLSIDSKGNLYLFYAHYGDKFNQAQEQAYNKKYPNDKLIVNEAKTKHTTTIGYRHYWNARAQDPVLLFSNNNGKNWKFLTTKKLKKR